MTVNDSGTAPQSEGQDVPYRVAQQIASGESGFVDRLERYKERTNDVGIFASRLSLMVGMESASATVYLFDSDCGLILTEDEFDKLVEDIKTGFYMNFDDEAIQGHNRNCLLKEYRHREKTPEKPKPPKKPTSGHVYLLRGEGCFKIGRAKDPRSRTDTLGTQLPYPVELVHSVYRSDYQRAEKDLHERFADKRLNGEWFDLSDEDVSWIMGLADDEQSGGKS